MTDDLGEPVRAKIGDFSLVVSNRIVDYDPGLETVEQVNDGVAGRTQHFAEILRLRKDIWDRI